MWGWTSSSWLCSNWSWKTTSFQRCHHVPWCPVVQPVPSSVETAAPTPHPSTYQLGRDSPAWSKGGRLLSPRLPCILLGSHPKVEQYFWAAEEQKSTCNFSEGSFAIYLVSKPKRNSCNQNCQCSSLRSSEGAGFHSKLPLLVHWKMYLLVHDLQLD